ncbi:MAG: hypothetical protein LUH53_04990, partial [Lachnospiraceae bacterium]|nr:hypothetical protein [Lachnospiraceae bacterium]
MKTEMLSIIRSIKRCWSRAKSAIHSRIKKTNFGQSKKTNASALPPFLSYNRLSESQRRIKRGFLRPHFLNSPTFF